MLQGADKAVAAHGADAVGLQVGEFSIDDRAVGKGEEGDVVLDPFGGSMTTGYVAEGLNRRWIGVDTVEEYLDGAKFRFE